MTKDERAKADILHLLRECTSRPGQSLADMCTEAATEMVRLRQENAALRQQDWDALKDHANRVLKAVATPAALASAQREGG
jgi:hypothetical protein